MRGLFAAGLFLAPTLVSAFTLPGSSDKRDLETSAGKKIDVVSATNSLIPTEESHDVAGDIFVNLKFAKLADGDEDNNEDIDFENFDFESEIAELDLMRGQLLELEYRIYVKEDEIASAISAQEIDVNIGECDSLKCLIKVCLAKAHKLAYHVKHKVASLAGHGVEEAGVEGQRKKAHWKKPHWKKPHWPGRHGNHSHHNKTCHRPHRNGSHPHPHPPHWKKPHFRLPPKFCHCPPPPRHGPSHGKPPQPEDLPHGFLQGRPPPQEGPPHDSPLHHEGPPTEGPPHHGPPHDGPLRDGPERLDNHHRSGNHPLEFGDEKPPHRHPKGQPPHFRGYRRPVWFKVLHVFKFVIAGVLLTLLIAAVQRRCCHSARRQAKMARREERHRRRAYRRAAHKQAWKSWIARHFRHRFEDEEYEEKYGSFTSLSDDEEVDEVASTIAELHSAAGVVSDIVAAEEGRGRVSMESRTTSLPDYREREDLPSYDDSDGSEESSLIADGFRYTPGSSEYSSGDTPGVSEAGSVRGVLGDTKD